jgi:3'-phosphoadenosine 5'-phosphosulfate (PAPS) 3'-phosphatase
MITKSKSNPFIDSFIETLPWPMEIFGGAGQRALLVIFGTQAVYVHPKAWSLKKWDTCAPEAILLGVGGHPVDMYG